MTKLDTGSIRFHHGIAVCGSCMIAKAISRITESVLVFSNRVLPKFKATILGLDFYVPDHPLDSGLAFAAEIGETDQIKTNFSIMGRQQP